LTNGTTYGFSVVATNDNGDSTFALEATPSAGLPASNDLAPVITDLDGNTIPLVGDELTVSDGAWSVVLVQLAVELAGYRCELHGH
jgi:hypothetical protein